MSVVLRCFQDRDLPDVLAIERQLFPEDAWTAQMFAGELAQPTTRYYIVAEADGIIAGYAGLCVVGDQGDVQTIAVRADRQGLGIGTALLQELIAAARSRGCHELFLDVRADNDRARRLYRRTGFADVGVRRGYYQPSGTDAVVMRFRIPSREEQAGRR